MLNVRSEETRGFYKHIFEKCLADGSITFEKLIDELCDGHNFVEASYASKMIATRDKSEPIYDSHVRN